MSLDSGICYGCGRGVDEDDRLLIVLLRIMPGDRRSFGEYVCCVPCALRLAVALGLDSQERHALDLRGP